MELLAPEFFDGDGTAAALEAACADIDRWPEPVPGRTLALPVGGHTFQVGRTVAQGATLCPLTRPTAGTGRLIQRLNSLYLYFVLLGEPFPYSMCALCSSFLKTVPHLRKRSPDVFRHFQRDSDYGFRMTPSYIYHILRQHHTVMVASPCLSPSCNDSLTGHTYSTRTEHIQMIKKHDKNT